MNRTCNLMAALRLWRDVYAGHAVDTALILDGVESALAERDRYREALESIEANLVPAFADDPPSVQDAVEIVKSALKS